MFQENHNKQNTISLRSNFNNNNLLYERKPNLVYSKIYSSNSVVLPPFKKLFLSSILLYTGVQSYRQWRKYNKSIAIKSNSTVYWNVNKTIIDDDGLRLTHLLNGKKNDVMTFLDIIQTIEEIKNDDRITGFIADLSTINELTVNSKLGFAQLQEIKHALDELKEIKMKKLNNNFKMLALTDTFDSQEQYFLASSFDKISMEPAGIIPLTGYGTVQPFFKLLLEKFGIHTQSHIRNEYKNSFSYLTSTEYNNSQRKNLVQVYSNLTHQLAEGIAKGREKTLNKLKILKNSNLLISLLSSSKSIDDNTEKVIELINQGPYTANEAIELGLIDSLNYKRSIITNLKKEGSDKIIIFSKYHNTRSKEIHHEKKKILKLAEIKPVPNHVGISLININDDINSSCTEDIIKSLMKAGYDKNTEAIVLRIDSNGGDFGPSDAIWEAINFVKQECKKPIVASFGNVAASGAYYIASGCDKILASPGTITGSIGVTSVKPVISKQQLKKWGITLDEIHITEGTKYYSIFNELSGPHLEKFIKHVNEAYELFKKRVMDGRKMDTRKVDEVAGGQIWTGFDATTNGLVDKIGGISRAIQEAAHLALSQRGSEAFNNKEKKLINKYSFLRNSEEPSIEIVNYQKPASFLELFENTSLEQEIFTMDEIKENSNILNSSHSVKYSSPTTISSSNHQSLTNFKPSKTEFTNNVSIDLIQNLINYIHSINNNL